MSRITKTIIFLIVFPCSLATAGTVEENTRLKLDMEAIATSLMPKIDETFQNMNGSKLKEMVGYEGTNIEGVGLTLEQAEAAGKAKREKLYPEGEDSICTKNSCEVGHTFSTKAMLDRENDLEALGFSKDEKFFTKNNKGYLDAALKISKEAGDKFDFLTGNYSDCEKGSQVMEIRSIETCDQYYDIKETSCSINQIVEIEPKYTYLCSKKRGVYEKKCESKLNLSCFEKGLRESSIISNSPYFRVVTTADTGLDIGPTLGLQHLCLGKTCFAITEAGSNIIAPFDVKNIHLIKEFKLAMGGIAGTGDIVGTDVASRSSRMRRICKTLRECGGHIGTLLTGCELYLNGHLIVEGYSHSIKDLTPYLKEGKNELKITNWSSYKGLYWAITYVGSSSGKSECLNWQETWREQCENIS